LPDLVAALKPAGVRSEMKWKSALGGKQVQIEDPDGTPIELFEPARH
jgi:glyoxylase I family protein